MTINSIRLYECQVGIYNFASSKNELEHTISPQVGIGEVSFEQFRDFLTELFFEGTITKERIMVLFFFCSDVAIRTLSHGVECFQQFFNWSVQFITDHVCSWVRQHGGWVSQSSA